MYIYGPVTIKQNVAFSTADSKLTYALLYINSLLIFLKKGHVDFSSFVHQAVIGIGKS